MKSHTLSLSDIESIRRLQEVGCVTLSSDCGLSSTLSPKNLPASWARLAQRALGSYCMESKVSIVGTTSDY